MIFGKIARFDRTDVCAYVDHRTVTCKDEVLPKGIIYNWFKELHHRSKTIIDVLKPMPQMITL